ncbi:MAG: GNAT family N-acetyltransferase [Acidobacteriaceae bacterium]|nr:GNAT family N-acetyltransferase [Acidobacteriaceae bacterium]
MVAADIPAGLQLCRSSGWNQLEGDWSLFLQLSPTGCRVAEKNGEVVGTLATVRYQDRFSWLAMVLVNTQHRRAGIGTRLLQEGLALLSSNTCVRLDATSAGRELYRQHGFVDEYSLTRFTRSVDALQVAPVHPMIRPMREQDLSAVFRLDRTIFGADREPVLRSLYARSPECAWIARTCEITGYCFGRPGFLYQQLGPVIADHQNIARDLVLQCLAHVRSQWLGIDAPAHSPSWLRWLRSNGFAEERSFIRMHHGENRYPGHRERVFAVVGPEFG